MTTSDSNPTSTTLMTIQREPGGDACEVRCVHPANVLRGRANLLPAAEYRDLADIFAALADPTRAKIIHTLLSAELCTCDLAAISDISESAVSQHLRVLRRLRLIKSRRAGKIVYHSLDDAHIAALLQLCLEHLHDDDRRMTNGVE